jgi:ATP-dependent DNA ligase
MDKITLRNRTKAGKVKVWSIWTENDRVWVEWGLEGGKFQTTDYKAEPMNVGKANATNGCQQAEAEATALITKKKDEGYTDGDLVDSILNTEIDWEKSLPKAFCACKPISKLTPKFEKNDDWIMQRKANGHCLILHSTAKGEKHLYSRRMEPLDHFIGSDGIKEITDVLNSIPSCSIIITEFVATLPNGKEFPRAIASVIRTEDKVSALSKYNEQKKLGITFKMIVLDALFLGKDITGLNFLDRIELLKKHNLTVQDHWSCSEYDSRVEIAKKLKWEGHIIRKNNDSKLSYTLNGKADRKGSYKDKFLTEEDFVITGAKLGTGKNENVYAKFDIAQYVDGVLKGFGNCGPGTLTADQLKQLTTDINSGKRKFPFVVEIQYQSRQDDSGKLEFPQILRERDDKDPKECIFEE